MINALLSRFFVAQSPSHSHLAHFLLILPTCSQQAHLNDFSFIFKQIKLNESNAHRSSEFRTYNHLQLFERIECSYQHWTHSNFVVNSNKQQQQHWLAPVSHIFSKMILRTYLSAFKINIKHKIV